MSYFDGLKDFSNDLKEALTVDNQIKRLEKTHGLTIINKDLLSSYLIDNNYYYFSGFRKIFLRTYFSNKLVRWKGTFNIGVTEEHLLKLITLNHKLSILLLSYLSLIERRVKSRSSYFLAINYGSNMHFNLSLFSNITSLNEFYDKYYKALIENGKLNDEAIIHHIENYNCVLPIWVLIDNLPFGQFIKFMKNLKGEVKNKVFNEIFDTLNSKINLNEYLDTNEYLRTLEPLVLLRNRISHNQRIIDINFRSIFPKDKYKKVDTKKFKSPFIRDFLPVIKNNYYKLYDLVKLTKFFLTEEEYELLNIKFIQIIKENDLSVFKNIDCDYDLLLRNEIGIVID